MVLMLIDRRKDGESALDILDLACNPWRGADAEFESTDPDNPSQVHPDYDDYRVLPSPMALLLVEAFAPNGLAELPRYESEKPDDDAYGDAYWDEVIEPFEKRYRFC
jgi:hypothetical protein